MKTVRLDIRVNLSSKRLVNNGRYEHERQDGFVGFISSGALWEICRHSLFIETESPIMGVNVSWKWLTLDTVLA